MTDGTTESLVEQHDIDETDEIYGELFDHVQEMRKRGATPKELAPRLRELADDLEDHFGETSSWDKAPVDKDVTLAGGGDGD